MKHSITVDLKRGIDRSYTIVVQPGSLHVVPRTLVRMFGRRDVFVITDSTVARLYGHELLQRFAALDMNAMTLDIPPGEVSKNSEVVMSLQTQLLHHGVRRESIVLALGGGVVGDVAGFVAATVLRGIRFVQVPTTLLAQVDSSVGGKVGIDHPLGKNLIGAFHQPAAVFIDPRVLRSLPEVDFRNGLAEMVKIAAALDRRFFADLERHAEGIRKSGHEILSRFIARSAGLKAAVVQRDEFETGLRKTLNLGHTVGHAIETASSYTISHGQAVAMGMVAEADIARAMGILPVGEYQRLVSLLRTLGLPFQVTGIRDKKIFLSALALDKKGTDGRAKFVLLKAIGQSMVGVDVPSRFLEAIVRPS